MLGELSDLSGRQTTVCFPLRVLFCNFQENLFAMLQDKNPNRKAGFEATEAKHLRLSVCLRTRVFGTSCRYNLSLEPSSCIFAESDQILNKATTHYTPQPAIASPLMIYAAVVAAHCCPPCCWLFLHLPIASFPGCRLPPIVYSSVCAHNDRERAVENRFPFL